MAQDDRIHVSGLQTSDSPVTRYNEQAPDKLKIRVGDYLLMDQDMRSQLNGKQVLLKVARPYIYDTKVSTAGGKPLGIETFFCKSGISLIIKSIESGKAVASADPAPKEGERIVMVGLTEGTPEKLVKAMVSSKDTVELKMSRPALIGE